MTNNELYHFGIKGMKWGVRRFQNLDGSRTSLGLEHDREKYEDSVGGYTYNVDGPKKSLYSTVRKRYRNADAVRRKVENIGALNKHGKHSYTKEEIKERRRHLATLIKENGAIGLAKAISYADRNKYAEEFCDSVLAKGTKFSRIQLGDEFNKDFAWYGTFTKHDMDQYKAIFGRNLTRRDAAVTRKEAKELRKAGRNDEADRLEAAQKQRKVNQLNITAKSNIRVASNRNAARITGKLLQDKQFHKDLSDAINYAKKPGNMMRPGQQALLKDASNLLKKNPAKLSSQDQKVIYQALNLSLTYHATESQQRMQSAFYKAMKKEGYGAIIDINDKQYSSYHSNSPVIVFDNRKVNLASVSAIDDSWVDKNYGKYNIERLLKDVPEWLGGTIAKNSERSFEYATEYMDQVAERSRKNRGNNS